MDSGHGQTLSASDFQSATILSTETSTMLSQQDSSRSVSIRDALPTYVKELIAGGAAGGITKTIVAPLERVKILYQDFMAFNIEEHVHSVGSFSPFKSAPIERTKDAALVD